MVSGTCQIGGRPLTLTERAIYTIVATNGAGIHRTTIPITVIPGLPSIDNVPEQVVAPGQSVVIDFTNEGGAAGGGSGGGASGCSIEPALPAGFELINVDGSCRIMGTIPAGFTEQTYRVTATNAAGVETATVTIKADASVPIVFVPVLTLADTSIRSYMIDDPITAIEFMNAGGPVTSCSAGSTLPLPSGLTVGPVSGTCQLLGTPRVATAQNTYTITGTNAGGFGMVDIIIVVTSPPSITPSSTLLRFEIGQTTSRTITFANIGGSHHILHCRTHSASRAEYRCHNLRNHRVPHGNRTRFNDLL